jgi:RHS repeat-associated protein
VLADENLLEDDVFWALADHLGTVRRLVDNAGNAIRDRIFSAWGQVVEDTNPTFAYPFAFTGREYDPETGLYYYRARYYDPHTGRFLSEDPLSFAAGDTNLSRYVLNSPANYTDPTGMVLLGNDRIVTQVMPDGTQHLYYVDAGWLWNDAPVYIGTVCTINGTTLVYRNGMWALIAAVQREVSSLGTTDDWDAWFRDNCYDPFPPTYQNLAYLAGNTDLANRRKQAGHHAADLAEELMWVYATTHLFCCTPANMPAWARAGLDDVARFRAELGPVPGGGQVNGGVVARLDVGGRSFYGINAHGQPVTMTVNRISRTHAELDACQQAFNAGVRGGTGRLFVDAELCDPCGKYGAVRSLAQQLGLERLEIVTPGGVVTVIP